MKRRPFTDRVNQESKILQELSMISTLSNSSKAPSNLSYSRISLSKFKSEKSNSCLNDTFKSKKANISKGEESLIKASRKTTTPSLSSSKRSEGMNLTKLRTMLEKQKMTSPLRIRPSSKHSDSKSPSNSKAQRKSSPALHYKKIEPPVFHYRQKENVIPTTHPHQSKKNSMPSKSPSIPLNSKATRLYFTSSSKNVNQLESRRTSRKEKDSSIKKFPCKMSDLSSERQESLSPRLSTERKQLIGKIEASYRNLLSGNNTLKKSEGKKWDFKDMKMYSYNSYVKLYENIPQEMSDFTYN